MSDADDERESLSGEEEEVCELTDQMSDLSLEGAGHYNILDLSLDEFSHHSSPEYSADNEYSDSGSNRR